MLFAVIYFILRARCPIVSEQILLFTDLIHHNLISADLIALLTMVLLVNKIAIELSVWIGKLGFSQPISMRVLRSGIIFLDVMYTAAISDSAYDAMKDLMICSIVNTRPLIFGFGSFSKRNIWPPTLLQALDSLRNPASACAANIILLAQNIIPSSGYVAI